METTIKGNKKKKLLVLVLVILAGLLYFVIYRPMMKYIDTHTWATIQIVETVESDTYEARLESREFLKGDTYRLNSTTVTVEDISHYGEVTIKFEPEVKNMSTNELIKSAVIDKDNVLNIKEVCCDGDGASWRFRVTSNRYQ